MTKQEFFKELKFALRSHEYQDVEEILDYYDELFMERRERGESEEEIVNSFDPIEVIAQNFTEELNKKGKSKINKEQIKAAANKGKRQVKEAVDTGVRKAKDVADKSVKVAKKTARRAKEVASGKPSGLSYIVRVPVGILLIWLIIALSAVSAGLIAAMWAVVGATIFAGIAEMIASLLILVVAESPMVAFGALGVGALCAGLGFMLITPFRYFTKGLAISLKYVGKAIYRVFGGRKKVAVEEVEDEDI